MIRCRIYRKAFFKGFLFALVMGLCLYTRGAVTHSAPITPSGGAVKQAEATDDWFAEIDDMIQEMVVPATPNSPILSNPAVLVETNSSVRRATVKKQPAVVSPQETASNSAEEEVEEASIIQEILQSDYWLEDMFADPSSRNKASTAETQSDVQEGSPSQKELVTTKESIIQPQGPDVTTEEQLLTLERELLHDLTASVDEPEKPQAAPSGEGVRESAGVSLIEADLAATNPQETTVSQSESPDGVAVDTIEDELLAELDSFVTEGEQKAAAQVATEEEPSSLIAELISEEASAVSQEDSELDQVLEIAEQTPVREETVVPAGRIDEIRAQLDQAIANGDREQLMVLTGELSMLVESMPQESPSSAPKELVTATAEKAPPVSQKPMPQLANPSRHLKRFSQAGMPEETTPMRKAGERKQVAKVEPAKKAPLKKFSNQQVLVMEPKDNKRPLREKKVKLQASLPKDTKAAPSGSNAESVMPPVRRATQAGAAPAMQAAPKVDVSVFMRVVPSDEARVREQDVAPVRPRNASAIIPENSPDSLDAPVPMAW